MGRPDFWWVVIILVAIHFAVLFGGFWLCGPYCLGPKYSTTSTK